MRILLLMLAMAAPADPPPVCQRAASNAPLDAEGRYRCLGLPLEVTFRPGVPVSRVETADAVVLTQALPEGTLMFVHRPFPWGGLGKTNETLDTYLRTVLRSVDPKLQVETGPSPSSDRIDAIRAVKVAGSLGDGEARAVLARTWLGVMVAFGKFGTPYGHGGPAAKAFFGSLQIRPSDTPSGTVALEGGAEIDLPPEAWEATGRSQDPRQRVFHLSDPAGLLLVRDVPQSGSDCKSELRREEDAARKAEPTETLRVDTTSVRREGHRTGELVSMDALGTVGELRGQLLTFMFCSPAGRLVQLVLATQGPSPKARPRLMSMIDSVRVRKQPPPAGGGLLRVAMIGSYWPLHVDGPNESQRYGLEADLAQALVEELGTGVTYLTRAEIGPGGSLQAVAEGRADIAINALTPTKERRAQVDFTAPYLTLQFRIATRADEFPGPQSLESFAGKKGAAPKGPAYDLAKAKLPTATLQAVSGLSAGVKLLRAKKIDFLVGEDVGLYEVMEQAPGLEMAVPPLGPSPLAIATPKGSAAKYDALLGRLSGTISNLQQLYRPGFPLAPSELYVTNCRAGEGEERRIARIAVNGTPEGVLEVKEADPSLYVTPWFYFDENLEVAPSLDHVVPLDSTQYCVNAPVRLVEAPPGGEAALNKAIARMRKGAPRADWQVQNGVRRWFKLAGGAAGAIVPWSSSGGCSEDLSYCTSAGYLVVVVKGRQSASERVVVREDSEPKDPEGT